MNEEPHIPPLVHSHGMADAFAAEMMKNAKPTFMVSVVEVTEPPSDWQITEEDELEHELAGNCTLCECSPDALEPVFFMNWVTDSNYLWICYACAKHLGWISE